VRWLSGRFGALRLDGQV